MNAKRGKGSRRTQVVALDEVVNGEFRALVASVSESRGAMGLLEEEEYVPVATSLGRRGRTYRRQ